MRKSGLYSAILFSLGITIVLYLPFLGKLHLFDDVESFFTEVVGLLQTESYFKALQTDPDLWHFPPVFIWIQSFIVSLFRETPFFFRLSGPLAGFITLIVLYRIGRRVEDEKFGFIWMMAYAGTVLPLSFFKSGLPYPWTNLFMMLAVSYFAYYFMFREQRLKNLLLSSIFLGAAILTTGPVLLLIIMITFFTWWAVNRFMITIYWRDVLIYTASLLIFGGWWFVLHIRNGDPEGLMEVLTFHFRNLIHPLSDSKSLILNPVLFLLVGMFPVFIFSLPALKQSIVDSYRGKSFALWMRVFFWVSLVFSLFVNRMSNNYSTISFLPLSFLGAQMIYRIFQDKQRYRNYFRVLILLISLCAVFVYSWMCLYGLEIIHSGPAEWMELWKLMIIFRIPELWTWYDLIPGLIFIILIYFGLFGIKYKRTGLIIVFAATAFFFSASGLLFSSKYEKIMHSQSGLEQISLPEEKN